MALLQGIGSFFNDLSGSLTGANKNALTKESLNIQQQIAQQTLQNDLEQAKLKYSPELSKQRTKQIALIGIPILIIVGIIVYLKFFRG